MTKTEEILDTLREKFGPKTEVVALAADASVRRFFRLRPPDGSPLVAMVDPSGGASAVNRMVSARNCLDGAGIRVPRIVFRDDSRALLVFEDLGDLLLVDALRSAEHERAALWYREAGRIAAAVANLKISETASCLQNPRLDEAALYRELEFFIEHDLLARRGVGDRSLVNAAREACREVAARSAAPGLAYAHRDFHARNLMVLEDRGLAVLDFQDLRPAPPYYDLASLVRDPYVEPSAMLEAAAREAFAASTGEHAGGGIDEELFALVALQRDLKAIGTYAFQARHRSRPRFLESIPAAERLAVRAVHSLPRTLGERFESLLEDLGFAG